MQDEEPIECVGECDFVISRETHQDGDGRPVVEEVERCTRCGYVVARAVLSKSQPSP